jgi:hypothetical protein
LWEIILTTNNKGETMNTKKIFKITFVEEVTSSVKIEANTLEEAIKIVESGDFVGDEIEERDHFQITNSYEV